jgi:hypothetical protein
MGYTYWQQANITVGMSREQYEATMRDEKVIIYPGAVGLLNGLPPVEQTQVFKALDHLASLPRDRWAASGAQRLPGEPEAYVFDVTPNLYGFFSLNDAGQLVLEHLFRPETLQQYFPAKKQPVG